MVENKALILLEETASGGSRDFARAARELQLEPVLLSRDPHQISSALGNGIDAIRVDTSDIDAVIHACGQLQSRFRLAGITSAVDRLASVAALACQHFALPGPSPSAVSECCDKFLQRRRLNAAGIATPACHRAENAVSAAEQARKIGLPVVVKPVSGTNSSGVRLCSSPHEVAQHTGDLLASGTGKPAASLVLIEEFVSGPQYCVNTLGFDVAGISYMEFGEPPHFVLRGFQFPAALTDHDQQQLGQVAVRSLRALGLGWGPANAEIRMTPRGPVVIEINPRIVGAPDPAMIQAAHGIDLFKETIRLILGLPPNLRPALRRSAAVQFLLVERSGVLEQVTGLCEARSIHGIADVQIRVERGATVMRQGDFRDVVGEVSAVSSSIEEAKAALRQAMSKIKLSFAPLPEERRT
jgi:biotin carboxylase